MTQAQYSKLYRAARDSFSDITLAKKKALKKIYIEAASLAADAVRTAELSGLSSLTVASYHALEEALTAGGALISASIEKEIPLAITEAYGRYLNIDAAYLGDAFEAAGATGVLTQAGIYNMGLTVNHRLILATVNRMYSDGYSFSDRIWSTQQKTIVTKSGKIIKKWIGANGAYQDSIKQIISMGLAQGRDVFDIAADIQVYAADGKVKLMKRYGKLKAGTAEFKKRIPKNIDWRAVRLIRSELYASLQAASLEQGRMNPASSGWYDWKLTPGQQHKCVCPKLADDSPYKEDDIPAYPHSNCLCYLIPALIDQRDFVSNLKDWLADPSSQPGLEQWYRLQYLPGQV